jgi:hypothetical protein
MSAIRPPFRSVVIEALVHATEAEPKVLAAVQLLAPKEVPVEREHLSGYHGNPIVVLRAKIKKRGELKELWEKLMVNLEDGEREKIKRNLQEKVDERCRFHLRFDKQKATEGKLVLADSGDIIHLTAKVEAFPAKPEVAVERVREFICREMGI